MQCTICQIAFFIKAIIITNIKFVSVHTNATMKDNFCVYVFYSCNFLKYESIQNIM